MKNTRTLALSLLIGLSALYSTACKTTCSDCSYNSSNRTIVGETAWIVIDGINHAIEARIDTGARTTSIHAIDMKIEGAAKDFDANVGKSISFTVVDATGKAFKMNSTISGVTTVRNAQGTEQRYSVPMTLSWSGISKPIEVNLRDRSAMTYKLLIGRDWLSTHFLCNVDIAEVKPQ
ncbi:MULTISPECIES: RimK/LysX family protein [unclassified Lentimonas]|uniref:ATP-dependent zinc protease family protein n=1 Tax=unclassified Lentimonas TaxID=2630993 RepID=UPI00132C4444|nr:MULTISPECIES: RimK/LysX family protein [unclassified Lentimonas]CAA6678012.1 Protein of unknown function DUF785 [Lentimonas sp. CC4]CAA6686986.1 Protein of unknown function DUF785 [Lentimonas sp. CC6]CAA7075829.1 Protein of unknown function DUF785 [Lentimonas sp. CC4]CAA7172045.1 Protein of unknown function DUF785 [Lentimonas sp. CC21]CAA7182892.1 Protein of unknown function DUF785 [Lentimonas sp. CC8]